MKSLQAIIKEALDELIEKYLTTGTISITHNADTTGTRKDSNSYHVWHIGYILINEWNRYEEDESSLFIQLKAITNYSAFDPSDIQCEFSVDASKRGYTSLIKFYSTWETLKTDMLDAFLQLNKAQELI